VGAAESGCSGDEWFRHETQVSFGNTVFELKHGEFELKHGEQ